MSHRGKSPCRVPSVCLSVSVSTGMSYFLCESLYFSNPTATKADQ